MHRCSPGCPGLAEAVLNAAWQSSPLNFLKSLGQKETIPIFFFFFCSFKPLCKVVVVLWNGF